MSVYTALFITNILALIGMAYIDGKYLNDRLEEKLVFERWSLATIISAAIWVVYIIMTWGK